MKIPNHSLLMLTLPVAASLLFASCASVPYQDVSLNGPPETGFTTYASLPSGYSGDAYYYNNRYYAGGRYEPGTYTYEGRNYDHRYFHNGTYIYGGDYRPSSGSASFRDPSPRPSSSVSYTTYRTLPRDYSGDAYYYNNLYYAGGRYEPGTYTYEGRNYDHRYFHNGGYIYGGEYRPQAPSGSYSGSTTGPSTSARYTTYTSLPPDYSGDAYYYNNRYYAGGRFEPGTYTYEGRNYDNRYFHNGTYIYGGDYRPMAPVSTQGTLERLTPTSSIIRR